MMTTPSESTAGVDRLAATVTRLREDLAQARAEADARALVELAKGVLVERLRVGPSAAARELDSLAERSGLSRAELAADIVNHAAHDEVAELPRHDVADDPRPVPQRLRTAESGVLAADDVQAVAEAMLEHAMTPLGACAVAVWAVGPDLSLALDGSAGFAPEETRRWRYVPPGVRTPAANALREREVCWSVGDDPPSIGADRISGARAAVPALVGGRVVGVLEVCWERRIAPQPRRIVRQLEALAELCGHAMGALPGGESNPLGVGLAWLASMADALLDPAVVLTPVLDSAGGVADFHVAHANGAFVDPAGRPVESITGSTLLEAYPAAVGATALFDTICAVYTTGEPFSADGGPFAGIEAMSAHRAGDAVLLTWRPASGEAATELLRDAQRLTQIGGFDEDAITGVITWTDELFALYGVPVADGPVPLAELRRHTHPDDATAIARFVRTLLHHHRPASTTFRLRRPDGGHRHTRVIAEPVLDADGVVRSVRGAYQDISALYWTEVALAATRDQLATTEQESAERNRLARDLQRAIMPSTHDPIDLPDLLIAVRYQPAEKDHLVGGDWYDAVSLPSGEILVSVGDIAGHGIDAATGMVVLRNALRGLAATGAPPNQLLSWLNDVACGLTERIHATALCGLYDPATRVLRWARAGHLPPVLARDGRAQTLPLIDGLLLGVMPDVQYQEGTLRLRKDDVLVMYTDGLIERRDTSIDAAMEHLLTLIGPAAADLDGCLDLLLTHGDADTDDDACIVGIQLR